MDNDARVLEKELAQTILNTSDLGAKILLYLTFTSTKSIPNLYELIALDFNLNKVKVEQIRKEFKDHPFITETPAIFLNR